MGSKLYAVAFLFYSVTEGRLQNFFPAHGTVDLRTYLG